MTTPNLKLDEWAAAQDQPWVAVNGALNVIDALLPGTVVSNALATPPAAPVAGACYIVAATATGAWVGWEGNIAAYIGGAWVQVLPKEGWVVWIISANGRFVYTSGAWVALIKEAPKDGTAYARQDGAWVAVSVSGGTLGLEVGFAGTPTASELLQRISIPWTTTCPADFSGSVGHVGANPTAAFNIDVQDDAVSIGTVSIAPDGSFSFSTISGLEQVIAAGSLITFIAPASIDATIVDINATLVGYF